MAASVCDVYAFCVGVAGPARVAVEVRYVSSAKVRPGRTRREPPPRPALETAPQDPRHGAYRLLCCSDPAARTLLAAWRFPVPARRIPGRSRGGPGPPKSP